MNMLTDDFKKSLFLDSVDILKDWIDFGIDLKIEEEVLKNIPIVNTIGGLIKIGVNVADRNFLRQTLTFIKEFNNGNINKKKLDKYKKGIENNPKKCEREMERVLLLLNRNIDTEKSIMLAKLYKAYILEYINWDELCEYSEILDRMYFKDLEILKDIYDKKIIDEKGTDKFRIERIVSTGLIGLNPVSVFSFGENEIEDNKIKLNALGEKFSKIVFKI